MYIFQGNTNIQIKRFSETNKNDYVKDQAVICISGYVKYKRQVSPRDNFIKERHKGKKIESLNNTA